KNSWGIAASVFIFVFALGILRFHLAGAPAPYVFESEVGQKVSLTGFIIDEPDMKETTQNITIEASVNKEKTKVLATTAFGKDLKYGDQVNFEGKLEKPANFLTNQNKIFDYVNYLRKDGIFYVMKYPKINVVSRGNGNI